MENNISQSDLKKMIESASLALRERDAFYGGLLQEIFFKYSDMVPTAYLGFDAKKGEFELGVNPHYFKRLTVDQRVAILEHELLHFTHKTLFRLPFEKHKTSPEDQQICNIAADLAINQLIKNLPAGCALCKHHKVLTKEAFESAHPTPESQEACPGKALDIVQWIKDDGTPFPTLQTHELYHKLIKDEKEKQTDQDGKPKPGTQGTVAENLGAGAKPHDEHQWDDLTDEDKKKLLEEAKKLVKRTIEKTSNSYSKIPDSIKDLLQEIDVLSAGLNYKGILKSVIKKTISHTDREGTWKKPNKRYGAVAPGSKLGALPQCVFYIDTSGSISTTELNEFLRIMSGFLKNGVRTCHLGLWHTSLYYKKKYKLNEQMDASVVQSGGTDVGAALEDIKKTNPNLAIILTDGCYSDYPIKVNSEVLFIISKNGDRNHPLSHMGKTIPLESLK